MRVDVVPHLLAHVLATAQQHHSIFLEEQRVVDICIARSHGSLVHNDLLGTPDLQHRHSSNGAVRILQS